MTYVPDLPQDETDLSIIFQSGPEPQFDACTRDFLLESHAELVRRAGSGGLVEVRSLGIGTPWLYRFTFHTRGLGRDGLDPIQDVDRHTIALRFLPDFLLRANKFEMLQYVGPRHPAPFHPNICPLSGAICLEIYPGETCLQIVESLHDLIRWRIRQLAENDALNRPACSYGRELIAHPIDDRPLFGRRWEFEFESLENPS
jgi:hypothetical protein